MEKFPQVIAFESLDPFLRVIKQGPCSTATWGDISGDKRLVQVNLLAKLIVLLHEILFSLVIVPLLRQLLS